MKRIGFLCLFCFWNTIAFGQGEVPRPDVASQTHCAIPDDDKAIRAIADEWKNQYNRGNASEVASLYTDDAYYLTQHFVTGIVHPRDQIRAYVERGVDARYRVDSIEVLATDCSGDLGYAVARYKSTNGTEKAIGVNLVVLRKISGKWAIVAHESAVPDPASAIQHLDSETR